MKKSLVGMMALALVALCIGDLTLAQSKRLNYSDPSPVGSTEDQVGQNKSVKRTDATHIKFFSHPESADGNFIKKSLIKIEGINYLVDDVVATPGLNATNSGQDRVVSTDMLETMSDTRKIGNMLIHGFSPNTYKMTQQNIEISFDFSVAGNPDMTNTTNHQLEIADIRKQNSLDEFQNIFGENPLEKAFFGDGRDNQKPYVQSSYPATIIDKKQNEAFKWSFILPDDKAPIEEVISYGLAKLGGGIASVSHDPVMLDITPQMWIKAQNRMSLAYGDPNFKMPFPYLSPTIFYKTFKGDRVPLSGYSTFHLPTDTTDELSNSFKSLFVHNINPIAIEPVDVKRVDWQEGYAVLNRVVLPNSQLFLSPLGGPYICSDGKAHAWGDLLGTKDAQGNFQPLYNKIVPHPVMSYGTIWISKIQDGWKNNLAINNPNEIYLPYRFFLVGPGAWDMAFAADNWAPSFVIPAGDPACPTSNMNCNGKYFLYKIFPEQGARNLTIRDCADLTVDTVMDYITVPTSFEIVPPSGGFAPYQIACGKLNDDNIDDCVVSWRGRHTKLIDGANTDDPKADVYFVSDNGKMFASGVTVYYGFQDQNTGERVYVTEANKSSYDPKYAPKYVKAMDDAQIGAVEVTDLDRNGNIDIVMGDLVPRPVNNDPKNSTGHIVVAFGIDFFAKDNELVPVGFTRGIAADPVSFIKAGAKEDRILGVAAIDFDGLDQNIAALTNKLPLALRPNCCHHIDGVCAVSPLDALYAKGMSILPDLMVSLSQGQIMSRARQYPFVDDISNPTKLLPASCVQVEVCKNSKGEEIGLDKNHPCCKDSCNPDCTDLGMQVPQVSPSIDRPIPFGNTSQPGAVGVCVPFASRLISEEEIKIAWDNFKPAKINKRLLLAQASQEQVIASDAPINLGGLTEQTSDQPENNMMSWVDVRNSISQRMLELEMPAPLREQFVVASDQIMNYAIKAIVNPQSPLDQVAAMLFMGMIRYFNYDFAPISQSSQQSSNLALNPEEGANQQENILRGGVDIAPPPPPPPPDFGEQQAQPSQSGVLSLSQNFRQYELFHFQGSVSANNMYVVQSQQAQPVQPGGLGRQQLSPGLILNVVGIAPRGRTMLGQGEITVLINKNQPSKCQQDGPLSPGDECNLDHNTCGPDKICGIGCKCVPPITKTVEKEIMNASETKPTAYCQMVGFSSEARAKYYEETMAKIREVTGIKDFDCIGGEPGVSTAKITVYIPAASIAGANIAPDFAVNIGKSPGVGKNLPWAVLQTAGVLTVKNDYRKIEGKAVLVSPLKSEKTKGMDLPDLSSSVVPMLSQGYDLYTDFDPDAGQGITMTEGMNKSISTTIPVNKNLTISVNSAEMKNTPNTDLRYAVITIDLTTPKYSTVTRLLRDEEGERLTEMYAPKYDMEGLIKTLREEKAAMTEVTPLIYTNRGGLDFIIASNSGVSKTPLNAPISAMFLSAEAGAGAGSCGCSMTGAFDISSVATLLAFVGIMGVVVGVRRKKAGGR